MAVYFFGCPHCGAELEGDSSRAGRAINCPQCEQALTIPPPMGVPLTGPSGSTARAAEEPSLVHVSTDKGFKRGMMPAKAYTDAADALPSVPSDQDVLPSSASLDNAEPFVMASTGELEGYSLTEAEPDSELPAVSAKRKKKRDRAVAEPEPEPVPMWEDPKYQLLILVLVVGLIYLAVSWLRGGDKLEEVVAPPPPVNIPAKPGELPGASHPSIEALPQPPVGLPGAAPTTLPGAEVPPEAPATTPPVAPVIPKGLPGAVESPPAVPEVPMKTAPPAGGIPGAAPAPVTPEAPVTPPTPEAP